MHRIYVKIPEINYTSFRFLVTHFLSRFLQLERIGPHSQETGG